MFQSYNFYPHCYKNNIVFQNNRKSKKQPGGEINNFLRNIKTNSSFVIIISSITASHSCFISKQIIFLWKKGPITCIKILLMCFQIAFSFNDFLITIKRFHELFIFQDASTSSLIKDFFSIARMSWNPYHVSYNTIKSSSMITFDKLYWLERSVSLKFAIISEIFLGYKSLQFGSSSSREITTKPRKLWRVTQGRLFTYSELCCATRHVSRSAF